MEIKIGMKVACIACNKPIEVKENNIIKCWDGLYLDCPFCSRAINLEIYKNKAKIV